MPMLLAAVLESRNIQSLLNEFPDTDRLWLMVDPMSRRRVGELASHFLHTLDPAEVVLDRLRNLLGFALPAAANNQVQPVPEQAGTYTVLDGELYLVRVEDGACTCPLPAPCRHYMAAMIVNARYEPIPELHE